MLLRQDDLRCEIIREKASKVSLPCILHSSYFYLHSVLRLVSLHFYTYRQPTHRIEYSSAISQVNRSNALVNSVKKRGVVITSRWAFENLERFYRVFALGKGCVVIAFEFRNKTVLLILVPHLHTIIYGIQTFSPVRGKDGHRNLVIIFKLFSIETPWILNGLTRVFSRISKRLTPLTYISADTLTQIEDNNDAGQDSFGGQCAHDTLFDVWCGSHIFCE